MHHPDHWLSGHTPCRAGTVSRPFDWSESLQMRSSSFLLVALIDAIFLTYHHYMINILLPDINPFCLFDYFSFRLFDRWYRKVAPEAIGTAAKEVKRMNVFS